MLGRTLRISSSLPDESAIVIGTLAEFRQLDPNFNALAPTTGNPSDAIELIFEGEFAGPKTGG